MGRLVVITTPDLAPGFQLAGVETLAVDGFEKAQALLRELLASEDASLIAVRQDLLRGIDPRLQRQIETSYRPIVVAIPGGTPARSGEEHQRYIVELIRRAIGFHITLGTERSSTPSS